MTIGTAAAVIAAALGSPIGIEMWKAWRDRHKRDIETEQAALDLFYPLWKEEMSRVHAELAQLRALVIRLSDEVSRLGGDPKTIIYTQEQPHES